MLLTNKLIDGKTLTTFHKYDSDGNPSFKAEESVSDGYADVSSITNWDTFGYLTGKDFKFIRYQIYLLRASIGYNNLLLEEKIIANKYFVSGVEYFNVQVTPTEQDEFFSSFLKPKANEARELRDKAISKYIIRKVYTGVFSQANVDNLINDANDLRTEYLRDGTQGIGYGDTIEGVINFVKNDNGYSPFAIVGVDKDAKTFSVAGDKTSNIVAEKTIRIHSSTGNNNGYTVVSSSFDNTNTNIVVAEAIPSSVADGSIYTRGLLWHSGITTTNAAEIFDIYWNGLY